jgi:hypothetical protein
VIGAELKGERRGEAERKEISKVRRGAGLGGGEAREQRTARLGHFLF